MKAGPGGAEVDAIRPGIQGWISRGEALVVNEMSVVLTD
jgi:hypothetical protein